jgi:hypothetical protein
MATHGEKRWPPAGRFDGRLRGGFHGHRQQELDAPHLGVIGTSRHPIDHAIVTGCGLICSPICGFDSDTPLWENQLQVEALAALAA